jgi:predicted GNAT superfamily acetyltransferase
VGPSGGGPAAQSRRIRPAVEEDFGAILRLNAEWEHVTSSLDETRLAKLHTDAAYHRVVESEGAIVAFLLAFREGAGYDSPNYRWFQERGGEFLYVDRVIVQRELHGTGLGAALYEDLFAFAEAEGIGRVVCEVDIEPFNEASSRFHDRYGFEEVGTQWVAGGAKRVSLREARLDQRPR